MKTRLTKFAYWHLLIALAAILVCVQRLPLSYAQDKIIAIVNNDVITQKDLNDFMNFMRMQLQDEFETDVLEEKVAAMTQDMLEKLIEDKLILQEAKKDDGKIEISPKVWVSIQADPNRIKGRLNQIKESYGSENSFRLSLQQQGLTEADLEQRIREQFLMQNIVEIKIRNNITVLPAEVTDFYLKNSEQFDLPDAREVISIPIDSKEKAEAIRKRIIEGEDLQKVLEENSCSLDTMVVYPNKQLREDIEKTIFALKKDELSLPIEVFGRYYIFQLKKIIPSRRQSLSEVQEKIHWFIFEQKFQRALFDWLQELKKKAYIKIL